MFIAIIIPARFSSTRLPGKPLALINGQTMLSRVVRIARAAVAGLEDILITVATDDERILAHCQELGVAAVMTSSNTLTGTDRVAEPVTQLSRAPDFILNLQGDAPLTPPTVLRAMIDAFIHTPYDVITPVVQLSWSELDKLRLNKQRTPFSGTTATFDSKSGQAFWFSKQIIPAIRNEEELRLQSNLSPIYRHIGLYGYTQAMLKQFVQLPESAFEKLEGLEQLRILEAGYRIRCVPVSYKGYANMSGVDSPEDILRAEELIAAYGELLPSGATS